MSVTPAFAVGWIPGTWPPARRRCCPRSIRSEPQDDFIAFLSRRSTQPNCLDPYPVPTMNLERALRRALILVALVALTLGLALWGLGRTNGAKWIWALGTLPVAAGSADFHATRFRGRARGRRRDCAGVDGGRPGARGDAGRRRGRRHVCRRQRAGGLRRRARRARSEVAGRPRSEGRALAWRARNQRRRHRRGGGRRRNHGARRRNRARRWGDHQRGRHAR